MVLVSCKPEQPKVMTTEVTEITGNSAVCGGGVSDGGGVAGYGEEVSFTILDHTNGYEYVDLGLSVKWAAYNVGANKPEDYGNYYAWRETTTK